MAGGADMGAPVAACGAGGMAAGIGAWTGEVRQGGEVQLRRQGRHPVQLGDERQGDFGQD